MSNKPPMFTNHQQVVDYLSKCRMNGMEMRNHYFYLNNSLGRQYFKPKEPVLQNWLKTNQISIWLSVRGGIHKAIVDQWSKADQIELEMDLKEYLAEDIELAIAAAKRVQLLAEQHVRLLELSRQVNLDEWDIDSNIFINDTTTLLNNSGTIDTSWTGLRKRIIGV
jgi:hypothetical protein